MQESSLEDYLQILIMLQYIQLQKTTYYSFIENCNINLFAVHCLKNIVLRKIGSLERK